MFKAVQEELQVRAYILWLKERGLTHFFSPKNQKASEELNGEGEPTLKGVSNLSRSVDHCKENQISINSQHIEQTIPTPLVLHKNPPVAEGNVARVPVSPIQLLIVMDMSNLDSSGISDVFQLLERMLQAIQLSSECYKILPVAWEGNGSLSEGEVSEGSQGHLLSAIDRLRPQVIVTLGMIATLHCLLADTKLIRKGLPPWSSLRGRFFNSPLIKARLQQGPPVFSTFHPADLLRFPINKKVAWEDLKRLRKYLDTYLRPAFDQ